MSDTAALELDNVRRCYGSMVAVDDVSLSVARGEFLTFLGPSGSGKTSTLRLVGGFDNPDSGRILINGRRVDGLPAYLRDTATIFQTGALFPHKTVAENVAYGLRMRGVAKAEMPERVARALDIVRLGGYDDRYPNQLSGGQKQRVALARSIAVRPSILLFDEPLSALDLCLRLQLRAEIKRLHQELGFTAIYVTHDQGEAMAMSSRVAVMARGQIIQIDEPQTIFSSPVNEFVYKFIGESCCLPVQISDQGVTDENGISIDLKLSSKARNGPCRIYVRPSRFKLGQDDQAENRLNAKLHFVEFLGDVYRYHLMAGTTELFVDQPGTLPIQQGEVVGVSWDSADMRIFQ